MKARMKKIQLILHHGERDKFLLALQDLGIMHLEINEHHTPHQLEPLKEQRETLTKAIGFISATDATSNEQTSDKDAYQVAGEIHKISNTIDKISAQIEGVQKQILAVEPWGDFDLEIIKKLEDKGIAVKFYTAPEKAFSKYDFGKTPVANISKHRGLAHFITFEQGTTELPFDKIKLPDKSLSALNEEMNELEHDLSEAKESLKKHASDIPVLEMEIKRLNDEISYFMASSSLKKSFGTILYHITGWIPEQKLSDIENFLDKKKIAYLLSDPQPEDDVPIILKNKRYPEVFETITKIFELPHYRELDLTPVIAVFYPIFFAYCLGDSGYGLIFVILFGIGYFTFLKSSKVIAALGMILGMATMVIGIVKSGTIFGIQITEQKDLAFFDFFSKFVIIPETGDTPFNAFNVALILGLIQINVGVIAAIIRSWIYESFLASLSSIGKLFIIICTVTLFLGSAQQIELFLPYQELAKYGLIAGIALVLLFNNIRLPILERIGSGVLPLYFIFTGLLGDTLSYIRLFALGISSGILGLVINNIGNQIMESGFVGIVIGVIFLIFGHALNLFISGLGSFVHPLRLTFVEFYNNAGFKGGGISFKPFKKESLNTR